MCISDNRKRGGSITIRIGEEKDTETFVELGRIVHGEGVSNAFPYSPDKVRALCRSVFGEKRGRYGPLIAECDNMAVGMLIGMVDCLYYSEAIAATVIAFFVVPEFRGSLAAVKLLHAFKKWAMACKAQAIYVHATNGVRMKQTDRLMRKLGFSQIGGNYIIKTDC